MDVTLWLILSLAPVWPLCMHPKLPGTSLCAWGQPAKTHWRWLCRWLNVQSSVTCFSAQKKPLFCSTSSLKRVWNHKLMPWILTMNEMSGQLGCQDHLIFSCVLPFVLRQSCRKCVSAALRIASEIPTVGYCKGHFLSQCVVVPGEELTRAVCIQCKRKRREILLRVIKIPRPLRAASVSKNPFKVSLWAFTSLNFLIPVNRELQMLKLAEIVLTYRGCLV